MAQAYLRSAPEGDQRPDPLAEAVVARAATTRLDVVRSWLKPRIPSLTDEEIIFALSTAAKRGGADGFRMAVTLKNEFSWPADMDLTLACRDICESLAFCLKMETAAWALRTGLRFPAKSNHQIAWVDATNRKCMGTVVAIDPCYAAAVVQGFEGLVKAGQPRRVLAEQVVSNITTDEHAMSRIGGPPVLKAISA